MKWYRATLALVLYLLVLGMIYVVHMRFGQVDVVFYASAEDVLAATVIVASALFAFRLFGVFCNFEKIQIATICLLVGYALAISVPTVVDRSLSFYILEKLQQRGGGIRMDAFEFIFTHEYVKEHRLVDVRLTEQLQSGTIRIENGCVHLTSKGNFLAAASRWFRKNLLPRQRLLMGKYTDDLTDPFRHSFPTPEYLCNG
ncbi:hypothetical protein [Dokdonella soli]|uniref:Uncharacterized protein n=1 Tax=Dokdonella soli TaxID=529810 RepID=A0ABN1IDE4_9GAMM